MAENTVTAPIDRLPARPRASRLAEMFLRESQVTHRTLMLIRWVAIAGQATTVLIVHYQIGFPLPLTPVLLVIGASALLNVATSLQRGGRRLMEPEAAFHLGFDVTQLAALLYLTGGLNNPFAMLILAPVTVAATILSRYWAAMITLVSVVSVSILSTWHQPLPWVGPTPLLPPLYVTGVWLAFSIACIFLAAYCWSVASEARRIQQALAATQMALSREQRISALGALAAAAAHELGTPLATIAITAKELTRDLPPDSPWSDDANLILSQSERCRGILADLARAPDAEGDQPFNTTGLPAFLDELARPYREREVILDIVPRSIDQSLVPEVRRTPEMQHGLANILQNALQFARRRVQAVVAWDAATVTVVVSDDGPGFPPGLIGRLGEPYLSTRSRRDGAQSGHQGLGIFIALTLLERTGARLKFDNARSGGAEVMVEWPRRLIDQTMEGS